jgi:acetolactate decarboxylase
VFFYLPFLADLITGCNNPKSKSISFVKVTGQMKNVMWKGQLQGNIHLDTITPKNHLYGMGPVEFLTGEILVFDGHSYQSSVISDTTMRVNESFNLKAPFFAHSHIQNWTELSLPDTVQNLKQLQGYLLSLNFNAGQPYFFRLQGEVPKADIHIVNLPAGSTVSNPEEAHKGKKTFRITNVKSDILGFFSTAHQGIFTHQNSFLHLHLITADRKKMGHVDDLTLSSRSMKLFLPK